MITALTFVSSWTGIATLVASGSAAVGACVAVFMAVRNRKAVITIHAIVNSSMKALVKRNEQLVQSIQAQGGVIPPVPDDLLPEELNDESS